MHSLLLPHFFLLFFVFLLCEYVPFFLSLSLSFFEPNMCPHAAAASRYVHFSFCIFVLMIFFTPKRYPSLDARIEVSILS